MSRSSKESDSIYRIPPYYYIHVLDQNSNVTKVETGPKTFIRQDNEKVILGPEKMITVPPRHYCIVENPCLRDKDGKLVLDDYGQIKLRHADQDIRLAQDPFPLYPGEVLKQGVTALRVVVANSALRLRAVLDFEDASGEKRVAGDEWLFEGPGTLIPRKEVEIIETVRATVIQPNQAIRLRARRETRDRDGHMRVTGEEWLVKKVGAYLPGAYEEVVTVEDAFVLTEKVSFTFSIINGIILITAAIIGLVFLIQFSVIVITFLVAIGINIIIIINVVLFGIVFVMSYLVSMSSLSIAFLFVVPLMIRYCVTKWFLRHSPTLKKKYTKNEK